MGNSNRAYGTTMHPTRSFKPEPGQSIVAYVRATQADGDTADIAAKRYTTLNAALAVCRAGLGDTVVVLPGHTENFASADSLSNLKAGTQIVGLGSGNLRPQFTWSAAASTVLIDVANVTLENCILLMSGPSGTTAITVAAPMTVSAAGFTLKNCRIETSIDADQLATIAITTTSDADDMTVDDCFIHGASDGTGVTTVIRLVGADRFRMRRTYIDASTSSTTVGTVQFLTTASTNVLFEDCTITNRKAASIHAATGMVGAVGVFNRCNFLILDNATAAGLETEGSLSFFNCQTANAVGEQGITKTPVST